MENIKNQKGMIGTIIVRTLLVFYSVIVIFPLFWNVYTSFKSNNEFYESVWSFPKQLYLNNYINAFVKARMGDYFINSVFVTLLSILFCTLLGVSTAYVLGRFVFPGLGFIKNLYMSSMFYPAILGLIPLFLLLNSINLLDNRLGLSIVYAIGAIPFTVYVLVGFFKTVSKEYEESALIDGCSYWGILVKIIVPIVKPAIITTIIFNFIWIWNEYIVALTFISTDAKRTLPIGLANLMEVQRYATDWGALFAGLVLVMLPTVVLYTLLQKKITGGLNVGGIKG